MNSTDCSQYLVAGIGEVLWDVLESSEEIGGAPVNFAYHINALGACGIPISTIGTDERGERTLNALALRQLSVTTISQNAHYRTGYVQVQVDAHGIATYEFPDNVAWDQLQLNQAALDAAPKLQAICFGSLAQRSPASRQTIKHFLELTPADCLRVFDLNLRQNFYDLPTVKASLHLADVLKLNDDELYVIARMLDLHGNDREQLAALLSRFQLKLVALTRGRHGSLIHTPYALVEHPGAPTQLADTIGAGDAFTAAITLGLLMQNSPETISDHANKLASYVCSKPGAMPRIPEEFKLL